MWQVVCISWCFKSSDFTMIAILSWWDGVASLVFIADSATSTELSCELCFVNLVLFVCLTCMCFLRAVRLCVVSCVYRVSM